MINHLIKFIIAIGLVILFHNYIIKGDVMKINFDDIDISSIIEKWWLALIVILLIPINWLIEAAKWKTACRRIPHLNIRLAWKSVLAAISFGMLSPYRIGEFIGRLTLIDKKWNKQALYGTFLCTLSQNIVTISLGIISSIWMMNNYRMIEMTSERTYLYNILLVGFFVTLFFFHKSILKKLNTIPIIKKYASVVDDNSHTYKTMVSILTLGLVRYAVYTSQFVLLIYFFGGSLDIVGAFCAVSTIYLIQTGLPVPSFFDLFTRSEISIFVFSLMDLEPAIVLLSSSTLWVINLIIPSFLGLLYLRDMDIIDNIGLKRTT